MSEEKLETKKKKEEKKEVAATTNVVAVVDTSPVNAELEGLKKELQSTKELNVYLKDQLKKTEDQLAAKSNALLEEKSKAKASTTSLPEGKVSFKGEKFEILSSKIVKDVNHDFKMRYLGDQDLVLLVRKIG